MIEELKGAREFSLRSTGEMTKLVGEIMRLKGLDSRLDEVMEVRQQGFGEPLPGL